MVLSSTSIGRCVCLPHITANGEKKRGRTHNGGKEARQLKNGQRNKTRRARTSKEGAGAAGGGRGSERRREVGGGGWGEEGASREVAVVAPCSGTECSSVRLGPTLPVLYSAPSRVAGNCPVSTPSLFWSVLPPVVLLQSRGSLVGCGRRRTRGCLVGRLLGDDRRRGSQNKKQRESGVDAPRQGRRTGEDHSGMGVGRLKGGK